MADCKECSTEWPEDSLKDGLCPLCEMVNDPKLSKFGGFGVLPASPEFWQDAFNRRARMHVEGYRDPLLPNEERDELMGADMMFLMRARQAVVDAAEYVQEEGVTASEAMLRSIAAELRMALEVGLMLGREETAAPSGVFDPSEPGAPGNDTPEERHDFDA